MFDFLRDELGYIRASLGDLAQSSFDTKRDIAEIKADLREHMRRTSLAEESIATLRSEVKPISMHVAVVGALAKLLTLLGVAVGIVAGLVKIVEHFVHP